MRHSMATSRLLAVATLTALICGTVGVSASAVAREPSANPFNDRGLRVTEPGNGPLTRSGTRGIVDPKRLPRHAQESVQRPTKPFLSRSTPAATGPAAPAPAGVAIAPDPVEAIPTLNPPVGRPGDDGFSFTSGPATNYQPADPWVAVGPDHVIQTVNTSMQILDRNGNRILALSLADFFELPPGYGNANARVIFDSLHQRWVMTELSWVCDGSGGFGYIDYSVSTTADPTDPWVLSYLEFDDFLPDYPAPGSSTVNLAFAANIFHMVPGGDCLGAGVTYEGTDMLFADWADILSPPSAAFAELFLGPPDFDLGFFTARIAVQTPATSPTVFSVVQYDDPADLVGTGPVIPAYFAFAGSVVAGTLDIVGVNDLTGDGVVAPFVEPPDPLQPAPTNPVTTRIDSRPTDAIWQANRLTWVSTHGCMPTGDLSLQACARVTQIDTSVVAAPASRQDFLVAAADKDSYFGGVGQALDGTLHVVWTTSSATSIYPSSYTAYQLPGDAANSLSAPELLRAGIAPSFSGGRWGDYSGVAQDPQVPNAVWQGNMYSGGAAIWKTYISQLQTGGSSYVPITPLRILDTRPAYSIGLAGAFPANTPRTFQVAGLGGAAGIPANAIAITGNVTVAGQNAAGYVSVTPTAVANPLSSTINFPVGDNRANNVTLPLSAVGRLAAVYKAPAGRSTHLIVDVTGYFLAGPEDATYAPVTPVRVLDTRPAFSIGLPGAFVANVPRQLNITGRPEIPDDAVAITGNLTVVGQARAGYLSITKTSVVNPTTSTLNFPLGDTRANGVSVPLNPAGGLWIVYKASGGTTHVILDVTGYYRDDPSGLLFYPLTPGRILDTRPGVVLSGLSGRFAANAPRLLDEAGHWGVPASANAISGNLTVVNQTGAGYVSATLASQVNPTTSVLNFPLGDTRANGVTLPLNAGGDSWFVYKSAAGRMTHLILDLSGYFD